MHIDIHVFSEIPSERFVFINMKKRKFYLKRRTFLKGAIGILGTGFSLNASKNDRECETTQEDMLDHIGVKIILRELF